MQHLRPLPHKPMPLFAIILFSIPHNLCAKVDIQGTNLRIEAWFDNETPADGAKVKLLSNKKTLHEAVTDEKGLCSIPAPGAGNYTIDVNAGGGHRTEITFTIEAAIEEQTAGADKESVFQRRWLGAAIGLGVIVALTMVGRTAFRKAN
ncbi:MAG: carboxypeptidase-like regulatory domain-containing protein [Gemmatales bacterium]